MLQLEPFIDKSTCENQGQWEANRGCPAAVGHSLGYRHDSSQENRKMKQWSTYSPKQKLQEIEIKQNRDGKDQLVHPADNSVMFLWGLAYCSAWC